MLDIKAVKEYFLNLQVSICSALEQIDNKEKFYHDHWQKENNTGYGKTFVIDNGEVFERGGVNFSLISASNMPASASGGRPELKGCDFTAMGVSLVLHPDNPFVPTVHMNVRFFIAFKKNKKPIWWFGGGYDLTPYYGFEHDCIHWHKNAKNACHPFGDEVYAKYKKWCDDYFYLKHRNESRGIGGVFFDDLNEGGFNRCFSFTKSIGDSFLNGYAPIVQKRKATKFSNKHKKWQTYRRGRYVEFNLIYDRGTLFGLQSGGRSESILVSMPPVACWQYQYQPKKNTPEAKLYSDFLIPKDWI